MANKDVEKNARVASRDDQAAREDALAVAPLDKDRGGQDSQSTLVTEKRDVVSPFAVSEQEEINEENTPVEVSPEDGLTGQVPVMTPSTYAPISSQPLPNAQRDAAKLTMDRSDSGLADETLVKPESVRFEAGASGKRDARDLAALIRNYPFLVNQLDGIEEFERGLGVKNPAGWVANPVDLLEEAKRYNFEFIGDNGNVVARSF